MANKSDKKDKKKDAKKSKEKYPDSEMKPYNPFAVCTKSVGRDDPDKYESCIQQVKQQNRETNMKDKKKDKKAQKDKKASSEDKLMNKVAAMEKLATYTIDQYGPYNLLEETWKGTPEQLAEIKNWLNIAPRIAFALSNRPDSEDEDPTIKLSYVQMANAINTLFEATLPNVIDRPKKAW